MKINNFWKSFLSGYIFSTYVFFIGLIFVVVYLVGFVHGSLSGYKVAENGFLENIKKIIASTNNTSANPTPQVIYKEVSTPTTNNGNLLDVSWGGPQLWAEVNKKRSSLGVNELKNESRLCTIASIRLNELLDLGELDGHEGFSNMSERRPDLKDIFESFSNVSEFLVMGAQTPMEAVNMWENTLGHKKLLTGGEYVWGCIYAQNGFGVAITAY